MGIRNDLYELIRVHEETLGSKPAAIMLDQKDSDTVREELLQRLEYHMVPADLTASLFDIRFQGVRLILDCEDSGSLEFSRSLEHKAEPKDNKDFSFRMAFMTTDIAGRGAGA